MTVLPPEIKQRLQAEGMQASAITTDATDAFERAEFIEATLGKWLKEQKAKRPHLFIAAAQTDLEQSAFADGNLTSRMKLTKQIGETDADARAKEWGLSGLHDYKTRGQRPGGEANNTPKEKGDNPWREGSWNITKQMSVYRADPVLAERLAKAAGSFIGSAHPARAAS